ncbi:hypothetical protein [Frankia sp. Cas3]|uniref:hypothetical protein n=1 Tax=Frankia sp. Cas3 TaxID=3073926 RepID=UPI002AD29A57|nr:hypothetical protein [Frankia sp. Cas3]
MTACSTGGEVGQTGSVAANARSPSRSAGSTRPSAAVSQAIEVASQRGLYALTRLDRSPGQHIPGVPRRPGQHHLATVACHQPDVEPDGHGHPDALPNTVAGTRRPAGTPPSITEP